MRVLSTSFTIPINRHEGLLFKDQQMIFESTQAFTTCLSDMTIYQERSTNSGISEDLHKILQVIISSVVSGRFNQANHSVSYSQHRLSKKSITWQLIGFFLAAFMMISIEKVESAAVKLQNFTSIDQTRNSVGCIVREELVDVRPYIQNHTLSSTFEPPVVLHQVCTGHCPGFPEEQSCKSVKTYTQIVKVSHTNENFHGEVDVLVIHDEACMCPHRPIIQPTHTPKLTRIRCQNRCHFYRSKLKLCEVKRSTCFNHKTRQAAKLCRHCRSRSHSRQNI